MKKLTILLPIFLLSIGLFAQDEAPTENVILISLDGLRWEELFTGVDPDLIDKKDYVHDVKALKEAFWDKDPLERRKKLMPFFWSTLASKGQIHGNRAYDNQVDASNQMWFSYPGYNEILTGFSDDKRIKSNDKIQNPNKTVLEFANNSPAYKGKVAAFGSWDVFPFIINEKRSKIPVNAGFELATGRKLSDKEKFLNELQPQVPSPWAAVRLDAFTHNYALEYLKKKQPKLLYIAYGETDDFAHDGKYDAYLHAAHRTDGFIKELWDWTQSQEAYAGKTTFIITTDHGRGKGKEWKSHGLKIEGAGAIWIAAIGPHTEALGEVKEPVQLYQNQVAKTVATLLGLDYSNEKTVGEEITAIVGE
ncbi:phosphoglyceromutase [Flammeovirgaceae bacterium SG7u.111]|nr:phosphoglyceromutase [Flammeovirgaceae bacterium SG7u.132]WPO38531.1 phosphoglyceromutase [Flammeovirgaceae bacterium SG7u.111]